MGRTFKSINFNSVRFHGIKIDAGTQLNNEKFNLTEYRKIKIDEIGTSSYTMSPKQWIQRTNAIGYIN